MEIFDCIETQQSENSNITVLIQIICTVSKWQPLILYMPHINLSPVIFPGSRPIIVSAESPVFIF